VPFYSDTLFSVTKSIHGNTCMQVTTNGALIHVYPMASKSEAGDVLSKFVEDIDIPDILVVDGAQEQVGKNTEFNQTCKFYKIQQQ